MDRLSMSLDQLIEKNHQEKKEAFKAKREAKNNNRNNSNKSFGAAKKNHVNHGADDRLTQPYSQKAVTHSQPLTYKPIKVGGEKKTFTVTNNSGSIFDRISGRAPSGTFVVFTNLNRSVTEGDLQELCATAGEVKSVTKPNGGTSRVLFARRSEATVAVAKYNGLTLDGQVMTVTLAEDAQPSVFDRIQAAAPVPANVKSGLFGTSMAEDDDEEDASDSESGPVFQVTMNGARKPSNNNNNNNGGGRKGGRKNRRNNGNREPREPKKEVNLDDDLDEYMKQR